MNQADVSKLVSQLRVKVLPRARKLKNPRGPEGRLENLRNIVSGLIKHERIELNYQKADEARGYAERLISEAIRHGDCHETTMEIADFWLVEKQLVHKLFKVLVPRYQNSSQSYTRIFKAPMSYPKATMPRAVLELKDSTQYKLGNKREVSRTLKQFYSNTFLVDSDICLGYSFTFDKRVNSLIQFQPPGTMPTTTLLRNSAVKLTRGHYQDMASPEDGNPYPPLTKDLSQNRNLLHNILLDAARKEYRQDQYMRIAQGMSSEEKSKLSEEGKS